MLEWQCIVEGSLCVVDRAANKRLTTKLPVLEGPFTMTCKGGNPLVWWEWEDHRLGLNSLCLFAFSLFSDICPLEAKVQL